jgi:tRNA threonylcarbamoyladenosine modification (KEOPS) complex  Pcc1 subunit
MRIPGFVIALAWTAAAGAGTAAPAGFDAAMLPAAFGPPAADPATIAAKIRQRLPSNMSVVHADSLVAVAPEPMQAEHIASIDATLRRHAFPKLERRTLIVIAAEDDAALRALAESLYPAMAGQDMPAGGFYHPIDRVIVIETMAGDSALLRELTRAHLRDDNPKAPRWFELALVTLYENVEPRDGRLVPTLDWRMDYIPPNEDLSYDVFAGICDCSQVSADQIALMRLLLVFIDRDGRLPELLSTIAALGQYTTLLQALDQMNFDGTAWKAFAERSVRDYAR